MIYPLVICYIAIENGHVEIVSFPINSMVDLSIVLCKTVYHRGYIIYTSNHIYPKIWTQNHGKQHGRCCFFLGKCHAIGRWCHVLHQVDGFLVTLRNAHSVALISTGPGPKGPHGHTRKSPKKHRKAWLFPDSMGL